MDNLSIDDLRPGMIVAERVSDPSGRILLEGHTPITPEVIRVLRSWGIQHIPILPQEGVARLLLRTLGIHLTVKS